MNIALVPNSGHHFFFIPLAVNDPNPRNRWDTIATCQDSDIREWLLAGDQDPDFQQQLARIAANDALPWMVHKPWLRYRLGFRKASKPQLPALIGLWLAFETNLGDVRTRGMTIATDIQEQPVRIDEATYDAISAPPRNVYVANSVSELTLNQEISLAEDFKAMLEQLFLQATNAQTTIAWGPLPPLTYSWIANDGESINVDLVIDFGNTRSVVLALETVSKIRDYGLKAGLKPITFTDEYDQPWDVTLPATGLVDSSFILRTPIFRHLEEQELITIHQTHCEEYQKTENVFVEDTTLLGRLLKRQKVEVKTTSSTAAYRDRSETRRPQRFVQLAHAVIGPALEDVLNEAGTQQAIAAGASIFQSSPKQYYWDYDPQGTGGNSYWQMLTLPYDAPSRLPYTPLDGEELQFLPLDGSQWPLDQPPQTHADPGMRTAGNNAEGKASYPRSDTLTWMALSILETAYRQINAGGQERSNIRKNLSGIYLTYPPGWTAQEKEGFKQKWEKALNIFMLTNLENATSSNPRLPQVHLELNEAVASQLPYVYSEILFAKPSAEHGPTRSKKASTLWFEQIGKIYEIHQRQQHAARIMTLDIGGGTSDVSILQYVDEQGEASISPDICLEASLLFKDSSSVAGNHIVREIIETVLFPALSPDLDALQQAWDSWKNCPTQTALCQKQLVIRQILNPIVCFWLEKLASNQSHPFENPKNGHRFFSPQDMGIHANCWNDFMEHLNLSLDVATPLPVNEEQFNRCIDNVFNHLDNNYLKFLSAVIASFDVDVLVVCGKVSELPYIKELLARNLPLDEARIVFYKNYRPGSWYPEYFLKAGAIHDPKTTTATGAALYRAFCQSQIPGWRLTQTLPQDTTSSNYWRPYPQGDNFFERSAQPETITTICNLNINTQIGRSQLADTAFRPEPVYRVRWSNQRDFGHATGTITRLTLKRIIVPQEHVDKLEIVAAEGYRVVNGNREVISTSDVELQLYPVSERSHWQENCEFNINREA